MNSGFRNLLGRRDTGKFKAYLLAIALQMLIVPLFVYVDLIQLNVPEFYPLGAMLGGFFFGLAMNLSRGCPAGVWYKVGGGSLGAVVAIIGLLVGYSVMDSGLLRPLRLQLQSFGRPVHAESMTVSALVDVPPIALCLPVALALLYYLLKHDEIPAESGWHWRKTGLWIGGIGVLAWVGSALSGRFFGMAILPGSNEMLNLVAGSNASVLNWDLLFVAGFLLALFFQCGAAAV